MEQWRFDAATKAFAAHHSRRSLLRGVVGGLLAGLVGSNGATAEENESHRAPKKQTGDSGASAEQERCSPKGLCKGGKTCCNGSCCDGNCLPDGTCCPPKQAICNDVCCPAGLGCAPAADETGTIPPGSPVVCCPQDRLVPGPSGPDMSCCPPGYVSMGGLLVSPPGELGGFCCRAEKVCGSGDSLSCCSSDPDFEQVCCNGACVATYCPPGKTFDQQSCSCVGGCPAECGVCEACDSSSNQCRPVADGTGCGTDQVCCKGGCVSTSCPPGETFDLASCGCRCSAETDCGAGKVCCNGSCVDGTCPPGKQFDPGTCDCQCVTGTTCGPFCCADNKVCCPDTLSGMSCRDPDANCPGCSYACGDQCCPQDKFCCRATDYSYHCVDNSGDTC